MIPWMHTKVQVCVYRLLNVHTGYNMYVLCRALVIVPASACNIEMREWLGDRLA